MDTALLKTLSETPGVSGDEAAVRAVLRSAIRSHADEVRVDVLGNLIARKRSSATLKVMLAAHMDEVGFMIVQIEKSGWLRFRTVGGFDSRILLSKRVQIGKDRVPGVIMAKPIHLTRDSEREQVVKVEDMAIDIGASSQEDAKRAVRPGDFAAFATAFSEHGETVRGQAFDDRAGCAVLVELLKESYPFDLYAAFTVQEEIGLRGARVAAYAVDPDVAFALDGTTADDLPREKGVKPATHLGAGPVITVADNQMIADKRLTRLLIDVADRQAIPYQIKPPGVGGTDAGRIHLAHEGVPATAVSIPCRYIHSPRAFLAPQDFDHTVALMKAALMELPGRMRR